MRGLDKRVRCEACVEKFIVWTRVHNIIKTPRRVNISERPRGVTSRRFFRANGTGTREYGQTAGELAGGGGRRLRRSIVDGLIHGGKSCEDVCERGALGGLLMPTSL